MRDFNLEIGGDAGSLLKSLKQADKALSDLASQATKSFTIPEESLANLSKSLSSFVNLAKGALTAVTGGFTIKKLTSDFMDYNTALANATQVQGYNVTNLEALGRVMERTGGNVKGAISSLDSLTSSLQQARWGSGALVQTAQQYGINYMKANRQLMNAEELLQSLSKQLNTFDSQTKQAIASQLGLDSALLRVIDTGNFNSLIAQQKQLYKTTQQDLQVATEFESAWLDLRDSFASLAQQISLKLMPILTKLMKWGISFINNIKSIGSSGKVAFLAIGVAVSSLFLKVGNLTKQVRMFTMLLSPLTLIKNVFTGIQTAVKGIFSPMRLIIMIVVLLILTVEDLYSFFKGKDSIAGRLAEQYPMVKKFLDGIGKVVDVIKEGISTTIDFFANLTWDDLIQGAKNACDSISGFFNDLFSSIGNFFNSIWDKFINAIYEKIPNFLKPYIPGFTAPAPPDIDTAKLQSPQIASQQSLTTNNSPTNVTNHTTINQNISGGDPSEITKKTQEGITKGNNYNVYIAGYTK